MRTSLDYLQSLADGRSVLLDGERVADVTAHPAFEGTARSMGDLYDYAADPANMMQGSSPDVPGKINLTYTIPRSGDDLRARREAIARWARLSAGFFGRSPDHVAAFLAGFASHAELFDRPGRDFAANVTRFYRQVATESLYVSYVIIPPQFDRSSTAGSWEEPIQVRVVDERDGGIVVRGAQMLGTGAAVSDYLLVSCIKPLAPGDEDHALSFAVPLGAEGLKLSCRMPYAPGKPSVYDYPLSTRFDESDALVMFDDVFVPWEDVFVYRDLDMVRDQWSATPAHVLGNTQAQIRFTTKLKFIAGIARRIAQVNGIDRIPSVQEKLADLASIAGIVEGQVLAAEAAHLVDDRGVARPHPRFLYSVMGLQGELYPRVLGLLRELAGAGVIQVPSSYRDLLGAETADYVKQYVRSPGVPAEDRIKLFKLAWDVVGSEFAGRHHQYEMFYAGAPFVAKGYAYRNYGFDEPLAMVDEFLAGYALPDELAGDAAG